MTQTNRGSNKTNPPPTLKQRLLTILPIFRCHFVPEDHILVVLQDNHVYDHLESGYHRRSLWELWDISYGQLIPLTMQLCEPVVEGVRSADGIPFTIRLRVRYTFDPRDCESDTAWSRLSRLEMSQIKGAVEAHVEEATHVIVGAHDQKWLHSGANLPVLQRRLGRELASRLRPLGITLLGNTVSVTAIVPPQHLETVTEETRGLTMAGEELAQMNSRQWDRASRADLLRRLNNLDISLTAISPKFAPLVHSLRELLAEPEPILEGDFEPRPYRNGQVNGQAAGYVNGNGRVGEWENGRGH